MLKFVLCCLVSFVVGYAIAGMLDALQAPATPSLTYQSDHNHVVLCAMGGGMEATYLNFCPPGDMPIPGGDN